MIRFCLPITGRRRRFPLVDFGRVAARHSAAIAPHSDQAVLDIARGADARRMLGALQRLLLRPARRYALPRGNSRAPARVVEELWNQT